MAVVLVLQQSLYPVSIVAPTDSIALHFSDFKPFSTAPPGLVRYDDTTWLLPEPTHLRDGGRLAVVDAASVRAFPLGRLSFAATFVGPAAGSGQPTRFSDELVVFATTDAATFHGFEFGVRLSLADGFVYAYSQFPNPLGGVVFQEHRMFANDGRPHVYDLALAGAAVTFGVDGTVRSAEFYPLGPHTDFFVIATAHRGSEGWDASGVALSVSDITVAPG